MFGACLNHVSLAEVAAVTSGLTKNSKREMLPLQLPYLRVANVFFDAIDTSEILEIGLTEEERDKTLLRSGDLLFVEGNGSPEQIGRVAIWHDEIVPCVHQNHIIKARFDTSQVIPTYAMHFFMSQEGRKQIKAKAVSTSGLYTLSVSKIADLCLPLPDIASQAAFCNFVEQADKSKFVARQATTSTYSMIQ